MFHGTCHGVFHKMFHGMFHKCFTRSGADAESHYVSIFSEVNQWN